MFKKSAKNFDSWRIFLNLFSKSPSLRGESLSLWTFRCYQMLAQVRTVVQRLSQERHS
jgi:hypothetical protein